MSALVIDLAGTADARRTAAATGQDPAHVIPAVIALRVGDYAFDPVSRLSGHITHFNHRDGETKAVMMGHGCSFAANLPDLMPVAQPH